MNLFIGKLQPVFHEMRMERYRLKRYIQNHFKEIKSIFKKEPWSAGSACIALALAIYKFTKPILLGLSLGIVIDYLGNTYFLYKKNPPSFSIFSFFQELDNLRGEGAYDKLKRSNFFDNDDVVKALVKCERLAAFDLAHLKKQEAYQKDSRPAVLILKAKADHNGALNLKDKDRAITINGDNDKGVKELKKKYKFILIDKITSIDQISEELKKITNTIQHVWVFAHGTPTSLQLDKKKYIKNSDLDGLKDLLHKKIASDAHVILYSCSTGKKVSSGKNIATKFSEMLPGRTIWAPKIPTGIMTLDLQNDFSIKANFWKTKSRLDFLMERIWNICCFHPFKKIERKKNVTAQVKDEMEIKIH